MLKPYRQRIIDGDFNNNDYPIEARILTKIIISISLDLLKKSKI